MNKIRLLVRILMIVIFPVYILFCLYLYLMQERLIFHPEQLADDHNFSFRGHFEEYRIPVSNDISLHALNFTTEQKEGVILYLHGNKGTVADYGKVAHHYTQLNHDFFIFDYRGYGKSEGEIYSEKQFYSDAQKAYDKLLEFYPEEQITVLGYSIGSATATMLAANNSPRQLILKAPYYSVVDMTDRKYPMAPTFLLKYKFRTNRYLKKVNCPVTIFHGDLDDQIYYGASVKLSKLFKREDKLITLDGQNHSDFEENVRYLEELSRLF